MAQLYDENGNPVDAFTEEEVTAKVEEETQKAIDAAAETNKKAIEDAQQQIKDLAEEKADLEEQLKEGGDLNKKGNFKNVRKSLEGKDEQIEILTKKIDDLTEGLGKRIEEIQFTNKRTEIESAILVAVGGDKEAAKKVEIAYGKFAGTPANTEELNERILNAIKLTTDDKGRPLLNSSVFNAAGGSKAPSVAGKISEEAAEMAMKNFGLTDKELKKAKLI